MLYFEARLPVGTIEIIEPVLSELVKKGFYIPKDYLQLSELEPFKTRADLIPVQYGRCDRDVFEQESGIDDLYLIDLRSIDVKNSNFERLGLNPCEKFDPLVIYIGSTEMTSGLVDLHAEAIPLEKKIAYDWHIFKDPRYKDRYGEVNYLVYSD